MKKLISAILLGLFLLAACAPAAGLPADGEHISWERAVELLHNGDVTQVFQAHSLDVTMTLTNGATVHTVEPSIDQIFIEIQECGAPCANIAQATE
jgi:predicted small secreted protein